MLVWNRIDGGALSQLARIESSDPVMSSDDAFTVSILALTPNLVSQITFTPNSMINGSRLVCQGPDGSGMIVDEVFPLQVTPSSKLR